MGGVFSSAANESSCRDKENVCMEEPSCICLTSDGSKDLFPENIPSTFTNHFSHPLVQDPDVTHTVRLRYIAINKAVLDSRPHSTSVSVYISEVEPQADGLKFTHRIGGFPKYSEEDVTDEEHTRRSRLVYRGEWEEYQKSQYYTYSFRNTPHLPLSNSAVTQIRVSLIDERGHFYTYPDGLPTIIMIDLEEDGGKDEGQFTVTCRSGGESLLQHPTNTLTNFASPLPSEIELKGYEVALQSLVFPPDLYDASGELNFSINETVYDINPYELRDTRQFVHRVKTLIDQSPFRLELTTEWEEGGSFQIMRRVRRIPVGGESGPRSIVMSFSDNFLKAMGSRRDIGRDYVFQPGNALNFGGTPSVHRLTPAAVSLLECDIVASNAVGGRLRPLLQCVELKNRRSNHVRLFEPRELIYQTVEERPFSLIRFRLTATGGEERKLLSNTQSVGGLDWDIIVNLVFRKKR